MAKSRESLPVVTNLMICLLIAEKGTAPKPLGFSSERFEKIFCSQAAMTNYGIIRSLTYAACVVISLFFPIAI
jgi:hypothetical protein